MDRPNVFSSTLLKEIDFEVPLRQAHSSPWARVLRGLQNVEVFAVYPSKRPQFYVGADNFGCDSYYGGSFLYISTPPVFSFYSYLAFSQTYRLLLRGAALMESDARALLRVLYRAYRGVTSVFRKPVDLRIELPLSCSYRLLFLS